MKKNYSTKANKLGYSYSVYEDNGGGLHLAIEKDGTVIRVFSGWEQDTMPGNLKRAIKRFEKDPSVIDEWDGETTSSFPKIGTQDFDGEKELGDYIAWAACLDGSYTQNVARMGTAARKALSVKDPH